MFAGRLSVSGHGAQDDRCCGVRQNRVVLASVADVKLPVASLIRPDRSCHQAGSDGGKRNSSPGRARHKPSNHCAGNAGVLRLYLYARVRTSLCTLHTRPRVQQAPGIPCSLSGGTRFMQTSGAKRRENAKLHPAVIACDKREAFAQGSECDEAIHGSASGEMDCFASLAMTVRRSRLTTPAASPKSWHSRGGPSARSPGSCADRRC